MGVRSWTGVWLVSALGILSLCPTRSHGQTLEIVQVSPDAGMFYGGIVDLFGVETVVQEVTITGSGFQAGMTVEFGGVPCTNVTVVDANTVTCIPPAGTGLGFTSVEVTVGTDVATALDSYLYGFIRSETNSDGFVDIADAVFLLEHLFLPQAATPLCLDALDIDDNGSLNIADPFVFLTFLFFQTTPPAPPFELLAPFAGAGLDPTPNDGLDCFGTP